MAYLLDADVLIDAKNRYYRFDLAPGFWDWLDQANAAGTVYSVDAVHTELKDRGDDLSDWVAARKAAMFLEPDEAVLNSLERVGTWAHGCGRYPPAAVATFLAAGDYYLVGHAHAQSHTVVTREAPQPAARKVKIPDACAELGVRCITPFEMLSAEGVRFQLG